MNRLTLACVTVGGLILSAAALAQIETDDTAAQGVTEQPAQKPLSLLETEVAPGETRRLSWAADGSFAGIAVPTPVLVAHGKQPGPVLCLTAAVHGDELNGIEMVRRVLYNIDPNQLHGSVIGVPIVNLQGFRRGSRYLPDRRDLNRYFPGDPEGSSASRIAHSFFESIVLKCDGLVDIHTGSFHRTNLPQLRADLGNEAVLNLTKGFGAIAVLQKDATTGTLRDAATEAGVPTVTLETGEPNRFQPKDVDLGVKGIRSLLNHLGMIKKTSLWGEPQPVFYESRWVRADRGGILLGKAKLGDKVKPGDELGTVTDPITNIRSVLVSPYRGRVLGKALNQVVMPGFAAFRIGIEKSEEEVVREAESEPEASSAEETAIQEKPKKKPKPKKPKPEEAGERPD